MFLVVVSYIKRRRSVRILSTTSARSTSSGGAKGRSFLTNHRPILYNRSWLVLFWLGEQYWSIYKVNIFEFRPTWNLLGLMTEVNEAKKWKFKYSPHKLAISISQRSWEKRNSLDRNPGTETEGTRKTSFKTESEVCSCWNDENPVFPPPFPPLRQKLKMRW